MGGLSRSDGLFRAVFYAASEQAGLGQGDG
jgi:hypothetical protein